MQTISAINQASNQYNYPMPIFPQGNPQGNTVQAPTVASNSLFMPATTTEPISTGFAKIAQTLDLILERLSVLTQVGGHRNCATTRPPQTQQVQAPQAGKQQSSGSFSSAMGSIGSYLRNSDAVKQSLSTIGEFMPALSWLSESKGLISGANAIGNVIGWFF